MKGEAANSAGQVDESKILPIPKNATNTVYVEGIPTDATEREVAHIFRPFMGFKTVRLIPREKRQGEKVILCFADFENTLQTTIVINTLQGYRFDRDDILGLQFSYALTNNKSYQQQNSSIATNLNGSTTGTNRRNSMEDQRGGSTKLKEDRAPAGKTNNSREPSPPLFPFNPENSTAQKSSIQCWAATGLDLPSFVSPTAVADNQQTLSYTTFCWIIHSKLLYNLHLVFISTHG